MSAVVNLDGSVVPAGQARVSVFDRGFLYGDSVYEVVRTYGGRPFELEAHLARLARSAARIGLAPRWDAARTAAEVTRTLAAAAAEPDPATPADAAPWNVGERSIRIVMTRGAGELGLDPGLAAGPLAVIIVQPLAGPPASAYVDGVAALLVGDPRPVDADPAVKTGVHLPHVLAVAAARAAGAHEALLVGADGRVTEGASSNVFAVSAGRLLTPPLAAGILEGVTRGVVLGLARGEGVPVDERPLTAADLEGADEVFITSTGREILPVTRLASASRAGATAAAAGAGAAARPVGAGTPGPVTRALHRSFRALAGGAVGLPATR